MPERFPNTSDDAIVQYVKLLLAAIGARETRPVPVPVLSSVS